MNYLLGIDVSTTSVKALLIDQGGTVVGTASTELPISTPHPLWSEQEPSDWWEGAVQSIRNVFSDTGLSGYDVAAVGLTGQMHGLTLLGRNGEVLRPAILWNDQRTGSQCDTIRQWIGKSHLIELTGNDALAGFTAPKILWVQEHEPEVFTKIEHILLPKDYVRFRLTDEYATDRAGAAGTLLLDIKTRNWSVEMLQTLDLPAEWLPPTHEGPEITSHISKKAAKITGLRSGTPVVGGGGDQAAQAVYCE